MPGGALVQVLLAVLPDRLTEVEPRLGLPPLLGVHVGAAALAPGQRAGLHVRKRDAFARGHDVFTVAPLGGERVVLVADVRGGDGHDLDVVAEQLHAGEPPGVQLPLPGHVRNVFHDHGLVAVDFGGAYDVVEGGAGALVSGLLDRFTVEVEGDLSVNLAVLPAPASSGAGRRGLGADRGGPQDVGRG